jgi:hypothetical protein
MVHRFVSGLLGVVLSAAMAAAQSLSVPSGVLAAGKEIEITYSNPARANGSVVIVLDNGEIPLERIELVVPLDGRGHGKVRWVVPNWWWVSFNADGAREVTRAVS